MDAERRVPVWVAVLLCLGAVALDHAADAPNVDGTAVALEHAIFTRAGAPEGVFTSLLVGAATCPERLRRS